MDIRSGTIAALYVFDVAEQIGNSLLEATEVKHYGPPQELKAMVAAGKLGRKSGEGFFKYQK